VRRSIKEAKVGRLVLCNIQSRIPRFGSGSCCAKADPDAKARLIIFSVKRYPV
jgi:hypothetical protein